MVRIDRPRNPDRPPREAVEAVITLAVGSERRLRETLLAAASADAIDPSARSELHGWTVGHVLAHLARNATEHLATITGRGSQRVAEPAWDLDQWAARPPANLVDDVVTSSSALEAALQNAEWERITRPTSGPAKSADSLVMSRVREVEVHSVDLGLAPPFSYGFADMPGEYVRRDLRLLSMVYRSRFPMGMSGLPAPVLAVSPHERLAWLLGRRAIAGIGDAGLSW